MVIFLNYTFTISAKEDEDFELMPALIKIFNRRHSDEIAARETDSIVARESVKEHLWALHFAEYGRSLSDIVNL